MKRLLSDSMLTCCLGLLVVAGCGASSPPDDTTPAVVSKSTDTHNGSHAADSAQHEPAAPSQSVIETRSFESSALGVKKDYVVYLPRGYATSSERRYPVLYLLHGLGGSEVNWRDLGIAAIADQVGFDGIIVMPDGDDGFYVNWAGSFDYDKCLAGARLTGKSDRMETYCVKTPRYEDYIVNDLRAHIDGTLRTRKGRAGRAIGGLSMGGYGALYLAMKHADVFGAVASHAGWAAIRYQQPQVYAKGKTRLIADPKAALAKAGGIGRMLALIFGTGIDNWTAHDPTQLASTLAPNRLAIYFDCGTEDEFKFQNHNQYLDEVLAGRGVPHEFHLIEGGHHNGAFWKSRVDDSLRFMRAFFERKPAVAQQ